MGVCTPPGPAAAPTPISCTPGRGWGPRGLGWAGGRGGGIERGMEELRGRVRFLLWGWREDPRNELCVTQSGLLPGEGRGAPRAGGLRGRPNHPPSPPPPPPPLAAAARQSGARGADVSRRLRGGGVGGRPFRFAHPSWNGRPRPERSGGSAPPCGVTAAGTAGRGAAAVSCVQTPLLSVQTPLRVQTPPALRRRDPPGGGRGSGPVSAPAARGEPRTPPPSGAGSLPGAAGSQPQPPRPPQPPAAPPARSYLSN